MGEGHSLISDFLESCGQSELSEDFNFPRHGFPDIDKARFWMVRLSAVHISGASGPQVGICDITDCNSGTPGCDGRFDRRLNEAAKRQTRFVPFPERVVGNSVVTETEVLCDPVTSDGAGRTPAP